ncbi:MAG: hypothetical protein H6810_07210 [Phycisphaeraceae bacterium]|nr:MAG: hypothetical protein H6810_07210 [Phycisphaeraceae bacterium]
MVSTVDGFGRFPQHLAHKGINVDESSWDEIGTEYHTIFELLAVYAIVGLIVGVMLAL